MMIKYLGQTVYVLDGSVSSGLVEVHEGLVRRPAAAGDVGRTDLVLGCFAHDGSGRIAILSTAERAIVASPLVS